MTDATAAQPKISVVILNYNGRQWLPRLFESLEKQTIFAVIEVIVPDNASSDGSDKLAEGWLNKTRKGRLIQNGANLGFCEGNNRGAAVATGEYLFFLNNDTWLEPDCLELLLRETQRAGAVASMPLVMDYDDSTFQTMGGPGLDPFGMATTGRCLADTSELFAAAGCGFLIQAEMFRKIGGFDPGHFMYAEEVDLSWRVWIAGERIVGVPSARLHHRGAVSSNPAGQTKIVESRTSETKRFLSNRNAILLLLKNAQHILLLLLVPHLALMMIEALASLVLIRRWRYVRKAYVGAVTDALRMIPHVREWRKRIRNFRQRGDFWMLRFLRLRPARWDEVKRVLRFGVPKVE